MTYGLKMVAGTLLAIPLYLFMKLSAWFWRIVEDRERQPATKTQSFTGGQ